MARIKFVYVNKTFSYSSKNSYFSNRDRIFQSENNY